MTPTAQPRLSMGPGQPNPTALTLAAIDPSRGNMAIATGFWLLCLFVFLMLGRMSDFILAGLHLPLMISCVTLVFGLVSGRMTVALHEKSSLMLALFTGCMILSVPFSLWRGGSVEILNSWLKSFTCFLLILALVTSVKRAITMIYVIAFAMVCVAILAIRFPSQIQGRLILQQGLYSGPNEIATAAVMGIIVWWYAFTRPGSNIAKRILCLGLLLFVGALLPKTGSRGGIIVLAIISIPIFLNLKLVARAVSVVAFALIVLVTFSVLPEHLRARYLSYFSATNIEDMESAEAQMQALTAEASSRERWNVLKDSLLVTVQHPVLGVGPGNFGVARYKDQVSEGKRGSYLGTHNTYTQISSEVGLPALGFFLASMLYAWRAVRQVEKLFKPLADMGAKDIVAAAFCMRLLLLSYIIGFFFEHIGYDPFYLLVAALSTAFSSAAMREYAYRQQQQLTPAIAAPAPPPGGAFAAAVPPAPVGLPAYGTAYGTAKLAEPAAGIPVSSSGYRFGGVRVARRP